MRGSNWAILAGALLLSACGGGGERATSTRDTGAMAGPVDSGGMGMGHLDSGGMKMGGMPMEGMQMMPQMQAHMDSMKSMSPEQMSAVMAAHDRMMSQMMDRMGADMRNMNMSGDAKWNALVDSVKADLADLPGLRGRELSMRVTAHAARVERLIGMHEGMMNGMQ